MRKKTNCHYCGTRLTEKWLDGSNRLFCEHCNEPIYENPVPATSVIVADNGKGVVLVKRNVEPKKGFWCLPGGFVELGETPEQSALRELQEETGLAGQIDKLLGVTTDESDRYGSVLMVGYLVKQYAGTLKPGDDASDAAYFHPEKLPEIAFSSHLHFINMYYESLRVGNGDRQYAGTFISNP
jgi:8-oxo-dGTP diphosphatase